MYSFMRCCTWSNSRQEAGYSVLSRAKFQVSMLPSGQRSCRVVYAIAAYMCLAAADQGAGAFGEQFQQDRVRHPPVENDRGLDAALDCVEAGLDLRDHAAGDRALGDQPARLARSKLRDQALVGVEHARDVGQAQTAARLDRGGASAGDLIGVDVIGLAAGANPDRRDDRDEIRLAKGGEHPILDPLRLAAQGEVHLAPPPAFHAAAPDLARPNESAILAGEADRAAAGAVDRDNQLLVDGP